LEPSLSQFVSSLRQIVGFRNILVHGYAAIQNQTVWGVVENDLTPLQVEIETLLAKASLP
jgi:uncharacterized protein YutE (UPF0331/DUF86 family)